MNPAKATSKGHISAPTEKAVETVGVGLLGRGTVGTAFVEQFDAAAKTTAARVGRLPVLTGVLRRSEGDFDQILQDSEVIVELMGGDAHPTLDYVEAALSEGRSVVTANKQLVAKHGERLSGMARKNGVQFRYEAAMAVAVPIIPVLTAHLRVTAIDRIAGIVNGTTNFILQEMATTNASFDDALARAQDLGFAEPDPSDDVNGKDAAAKMAILARLAFGTAVERRDVAREGIENIDPDDLVYAKEFGLALKLLGSAERHGDSLSVRVFPCFVSDRDPLANVQDALNAVTIDTPALGQITMSGAGAGARPTAEIVLNDVASAIAGHGKTEYVGVKENLTVDNRGLRSCFYIHLIVSDEPGVLASVADCLGEHDISIESAVQRGLGDKARLNLVTHECDEEAFWEALLDISKLRVTRSDPRAIRVRA